MRRPAETPLEKNARKLRTNDPEPCMAFHCQPGRGANEMIVPGA